MKEQIEFLTAWMEFILVKREPLRDEVDYKLSLCRWMLDRFGQKSGYICLLDVMDKYNIEKEYRTRLSEMIVNIAEPGLEQVLDECFQTELRRGMIATRLSFLFGCIDDRVRYDQYIRLVDLFYDFVDQCIFSSFVNLMWNTAMSQDQHSQVIQKLFEMFQDGEIWRRFGVNEEDLEYEDFLSVMRETLPLGACEHFDIMLKGMMRMHAKHNTYNFPRTVPISLRRRQLLLNLIGTDD